MPPQRLTRRNADPRSLYERAVQAPDAEISFVDRTYRRLRGRAATHLREDFCATAATCCEWVKRRRTNHAIGVDLDDSALEWSRRYNLTRLTPAQQNRLTLVRRDVRAAPPRKNAPASEPPPDIVLAMNFSWWIFDTRAELSRYFDVVRRSLAPGGILFLDHYGGWASSRVQLERRRIAATREFEGFTYIWDQHAHDPLSNRMVCYIHFELRDGTRIHRAFRYDWRLWTLPEVRELLQHAGFRRVTVHWEGDDGKGGGNGVFRPVEKAENCESFISYIVAET